MAGGARAYRSLELRSLELRSLALPLAVAAGLLVATASVRAGPQQYEALTDSVRTSLSAAIADDHHGEPLWGSVGQKVDWLAQQSARLPQRHKPTLAERLTFLETVRYEAQRAGLDPALVLGLIQVESGFRRHAISSAGARGYMQVMPFWVDVIGDGDPTALFDMRKNIRYGCVILRHYLDLEKGNLFMALGRYNGSRGRDAYPNAVLAAWKRWETP